MKYATLLLLTAVSFVFAGTPHAPLPPELMQAQTVYIENNSGRSDLDDKCYDELVKWGRFQVVTDPQKADVVFVIGMHEETTGYSGRVFSNGNMSMHQTGARWTTISIIGKQGNVLWSESRHWKAFGSATREVVKELRKRMDEQGKQ
jgi:hypothetical protein